MGLKFTTRAVILGWIAAVLAGCTLFDRPVQPPKGRTADQLYKEGSAQLEQKNYRAAIEAFYKLKYDYPSDTAAMLADLKIADAYYANKEYPQAIESYSDFRKMHPASPYIPYVVYMLGLCHYQQMLSVDRDQTNTEKALSEFQYLLTHFPNTPYAYDANEKAKECMKRLSDHEVYVGSFYYRMKKYPAAIQRFEAAISKYPTVPLDEEILFDLAEAYRMTQQQEKQQKALRALLQQYPKGKFAKRAEALLEGAPPEVALSAASQPAAPLFQTPPSAVSSQGAMVESSPSPPAKAETRRPLQEAIFSEVATNAERSEIPTSGASLRKEEGTFEGATSPDLKLTAEKGGRSTSGITPQGSDVLSETRLVKAETPTSVQDRQAPEMPPLLAGQDTSAWLEKAGPSASPASASEGVEDDPSFSRPMEEAPSPASVPSSPAGGRKPTIAKTLDDRLGFGQLKGDKPINISADRMDAFQRENRVVFEGNVVVNQEETYIYAQRITADIASQESGGGIQKVVAVKDVRITQNDRVATCDRAEFDHISRTIVLSGRPKIWQGKDWIDGERVLVNLDQDKMTVVGGEEKRVSAVLYPKTVKEAAEGPSGSKGSRPTMTAPLAPPTGGKARAEETERGDGKTATAVTTERTEATGPSPWDRGGSQGSASEGQEHQVASAPRPTQAKPTTPPPAHAQEEDAARIAKAALSERTSSKSEEKAADPSKPSRQHSAAQAGLDSWAPVRAFLEQWRKAWESKDLDAYMACYSSKFRAEKRDWNAWRSYKAGLNDRYKIIRVEVEKLEIIPQDGGVKASFIQRYRADGYQDVGRKVLELVQEEGRWKIIRETWQAM